MKKTTLKNRRQRPSLVGRGLKKVFFLLTLIAHCVFVSAQSFPVQVVPQLTPPAPIYLSDYADATSANSPLRVQLILNDFTIPTREVRLRLSFEGNGLSFQSNDLVTGAAPLFLEGGTPLNLGNTDLAPYLAFNNITGISPNAYGQPIPEGAYQFCFEVFDVLTGNRLSQRSCVTVAVFQNDPPFLVLPENKSTVVERNPLNLVFQWTPRQINVTNVEYELTLVEIWDPQVDPQQAFLSSNPVFQTTVNATTYVYGPADPQLLSNRSYAWRVQAKAKQGTEEIGLFENQGFSEIFSFSFAEQCALPTAIDHQIKGSTQANILWEDFTTTIPQFTVRYRKKSGASSGNNEWFETRTTANYVTLWDLKAGTTYQYQLQKQCPLNESDWSPVQEFTTALTNEETALYECGIAPDLAVTNKEPLPNITPGETITAGDFKITLNEVSGSNGRFTGNGYVAIPYLGNVRVGITFTNILVNTDKQLAEGTVVTTYNIDAGNIIDVDDAVDTFDDIADTVTEPFEGSNDLDEITVDFELDPERDIKIEDGKVVITNPNTGAVITEPLGDDMVVTDSTGQVYHIDAGGQVTKGGKIDSAGPVTSDSVDGVKRNGQIEALTASDILVTFNSPGTFGFDQMPPSAKEQLQKEYTLIEDTKGQDYVLPHHAVKKGAETQIVATVAIENNAYTVDQVIFKTKQGELIPKTIDGNQVTLTLKGHYTFENETIYATVPGNDNTDKQLTAGAFTLWHLTERVVDVALVSVNGASLGAIQQTVTDIFEKGVAKINFGQTLDLSFDSQQLGDNGLDVGESAWLGAYNDEQKQLISAVRRLEGYNSETYYILVFGNDIRPSRSIAGFMPLQRQMGFVFSGEGAEEGKGGDKGKVLAHELGHGIFALQHPFVQYNVAENSTDWLMDYNAATGLPHMHWGQIHDPALKFYVFQRDSDGLLIQKGITNYLSIKKENWEEYSFLSPVGTAIEIPEATHVKFNEDGAVMAFKIDEEKYLGLYNSEKQRFIGYINSKSSLLDSSMVYSEEFKEKFEKEKYLNIKFAAKNKRVFAIAKKRYRESYLNCIFQATWPNNILSNQYIGFARPPFIPNDADKLNRGGSQCADATADGVKDGIGIRLYYALIDSAKDENKADLIALSNFFTEKLSEKTYAFYGHVPKEGTSLNTMNTQFLRYMKENQIYSLKEFQQYFPYQTYARDVEIVFSNFDLRANIPEDYNINSTNYLILLNKGDKIKYEYSLSDLYVRREYLTDDNFIAKIIHKIESQGRAEAISTRDGYEQYVAQYGTDSAFILWAEFAANASKDMLTAFFAQRLVAQHGATIITELSREASQRFIRGALIEGFSNYLANELVSEFTGNEEELLTKDFFQDMILAGGKEVISPKILNPRNRKRIEFAFDCIIGLDIDVVDGLLKAKSYEEFTQFVLLSAGQCALPAFLGNKQDWIIDKIKKGNPLAKKALKLLTEKFRLNDKDKADFMIQLLGFDKILSKKNDYYIATLRRVLLTESGTEAIDVLIRSGFDITTLSARNLERLSNIVSKFGLSKELIDIFKGTKDVNRALIFLNNVVKNPDGYLELLSKIRNNHMFNNTITINGNTVRIEDFFENTSDAYLYYHKAIGNKHYYAKVNGLEGLRIVVDLAKQGTEQIEEILYGTKVNILKDGLSDGLKKIFDEE